MKKNTVLVLSSLILLSIIPGIALNDAFADKDEDKKPKFDLFVDAKKECPGEGTQKHPYCNIQLAVDNSEEDFKIKVKGGVYGAVTVDVDGLTIKKGSSPVVDCDGAGNGFDVNANGVSIIGFEITNCVNGISVNGASDTLIKKNKIHDNSLNGILLNSAFANLVRDNHINSNPTGILLSNSDGNLVSKNKLEENDSGIVLDSSSSLNFIHANTIEDGTTGILISDPGSVGNFLEDNKAKNNEGWGFDISSGTTLEENKAVGNGFGGFVIRGDINTLVNNKAVENNIVGFMGEGSSGIVFANNKAIENRGDGFVLSGNEDVVLIENKSKKNKGHGFSITDESNGIQLFDNDSVHNGMDGYNVDGESSFITLIDNTAKANRGDGFELFFDEEEDLGIEDSVVIKNKSEKNGGFGFVDEIAEDNIYVGNKCKGNDGGSSNPTGLCES